MRRGGNITVPVLQVSSSRLTRLFSHWLKGKILVWRDVFLGECVLMIDGSQLSIYPPFNTKHSVMLYNNIYTLNYNKRDYSSYSFSFQLLTFSFAFLNQNEIKLWISKQKCTVIFVLLLCWHLAHMSQCRHHEGTSDITFIWRLNYSSHIV